MIEQKEFRQLLLDKGYRSSDIDELMAKDPEFSQGVSKPTPSPSGVVPQGQTVSQPIPQQPTSDGNITQAFGNPNAALYGISRSGRANINRGVDISAKPGEAQFAPGKGKWIVQSAYSGSGYNTGWGKSVVIKNTETGETIRRSHLDDVFVRPGQAITGKAIGTTGRTGRTTGYHKDVEFTDPSGRLSDYTKSQYY